MKHLIKILAMVIPGIAIVFLLLSMIWNTIVSNHLKQFDKTFLSPTTYVATQEALAEKASYQAAEFRAKRVKEEALSRYDIERLHLKIEMLPRYATLKFYSAIGVVSVFGLSVIILAYGCAKAKIQQSSVCTARIGEHSIIPVHYRDLRDFYPIAVNLSLAEIEASVSDSHEKAFKISDAILKSISSYSRVKPEIGLPSQPETPALSQGIPTFREILNALEPGDPMVLGFDHNTGAPITGGFKRIYSCGIFGVSGSGKTTGLYSIIAQSLLLYPAIHYIVIDPHADRPEGLTKGLPKTSHFEHLDALNVRPGLTRFVQELDHRLKTDKKYTQEPYVLLIDELPVIMKSNQGQSVEAVLGRIPNEGRKVDMFALISGQDTRLKAAGGNRDLLTSQIAYNLKKKQARYLFDDSEIVDLHKVVRDAKEPGLCVFNATDDAPVLMKQPFCTPDDMQEVSRLLLKNNILDASQLQGAIEIRNAGETTQKPKETPETPLLVDVNKLRETVVSWVETRKETVSGLAKKIGINKGQVHRFIEGEQPSKNLQVALSSYYQKRLETP